MYLVFNNRDFFLFELVFLYKLHHEYVFLDLPGILIIATRYYRCINQRLCLPNLFFEKILITFSTIVVLISSKLANL